VEQIVVRICAALVAVALSACGYGASFNDCAIRCSAETGCPEGLVCGAVGRCRSPGSIETCAASVVVDAGAARPDAFDPGVCPPTYTISLPSTTSRYRLASSGLDWTTANGTCAADQTSPKGFTHLVVFADRQEQTDLEAIVGDVWVGYSDRISEGTFLATTSEPIGDYVALHSPAWAAGEPNAGVNEDCAEIILEGGLNDNNCALTRMYVCECDGYANDPSHY
jgi:Lectin C-type domain